MKLLKLFVLGVLSSSFSFAGTSSSGKFNPSLDKQNFVTCVGNKPGAFYFYTNTDGVTGQIVHQVTGAFPTKSTTVETYQIQAKDIKKGIMKGIMKLTSSGNLYSYQISQNERGNNDKGVYFDAIFTPKMASFYNCQFVVLN